MIFLTLFHQREPILLHKRTFYRLCELNLAIFYCLLYMQHVLCHLSCHTKTKTRRAPRIHKPILRELHWNLSIDILTFVFVWANECGCMLLLIVHLQIKHQNVWIRISARLRLNNDFPYKVCNKWLLKSRTQLIVLVQKIRLVVQFWR